MINRNREDFLFFFFFFFDNLQNQLALHIRSVCNQVYSRSVRECIERVIKCACVRV